MKKVNLKTNRTRTPKENTKTGILATEYKSNHECTSCALTFKSSNNLVDHNKQVHACEKNILCGKSFATARTINFHIETIHSGDNPYSCEYCGKSFNRSGNRNTYVETVHKTGPPLLCPHCGKLVKHTNTMDSHVKHVHKINDEKFTCEECGKVYRTKKDIQVHMRYHLPEDIKLAMKEKAMEKYKCNSCDKGFIDSTRLKWHEASRHTGIKSFICQHCPKSYFRSDHLKTHVTSVHGS